MKVLNLYGGVGGNRLLWKNCKVTMVEKDPIIAAAYQLQFPDDEVIVGDAMEYLLKNFWKFDFIWCSPSCQESSKMVKFTKHKRFVYPDLSIYQLIIFLEHFFKGKWIVENVDPYYKPLIHPTIQIGRHLFWSNFVISKIKIKNIPNFINQGTVEASERLKKHLGIKYEGNLYYKGNHDPCQVLRNCVPSEVGLHIFNLARGIIIDNNIEQGKLF